MQTLTFNAGQTIIGAGPNAMDAPLSYSPTIITENVIVYRGIAPVTAGIETLGGAVDTTLQQASFSDAYSFDVSGKLLVGFQQNADASNQATTINLNNNHAAALVYFDSKTANDIEAADGRKISPTGYDKTQAGVDARVKLADSLFGISYHYTDTHNAGTPALPMDIDFIYGHRANIDGRHQVAGGELSWQLGFMDADHKMDNFQERKNMIPAMYRSNHAESDSLSFAIKYQRKDLVFGVDGYQSTHNAVITNPNNIMFNVVNFNGVEDTKISAFAEWQHSVDQHLIKLGGRIKRIEADADQVSHHMAMMNPTVGMLVNQFNNADRSQSDTNIDLTIDWLLPQINDVQVMLSVAQKQRAPSYQERYLWLPMEATAGLADGNTYLGYIELDSETANQINLGLTYQGENFTLTSDIFYSDIKDYIQAIPNTDMKVNMFAHMMMNSDTVLRFANVDARLSGFDGQWHYQLDNNWQLNAVVSYVEGKRTDIDDNLYRVAPLNGHFAVSYQRDNWQLTTRFHAVSAQNEVANINNEQTTSGYGYIDLIGSYQFSDTLMVNFGVKNLTDREYASHLSGYNRVAMNELDSKERIPSAARNPWISATYQF